MTAVNSALSRTVASLPASSVPQQSSIAELGLSQEGLADKVDLHRTYIGSDVMWVYHRMPAQWTEENDAPNKGCWGLLQWARRNRGAFYGQMLPKVFQAHAKEAEEQKVWVESEPKTVEERLAIYTECMDRYEAERKRRGLGDMELLNAHRSRRHCLPHATS